MNSSSNIDDSDVNISSCKDFSLSDSESSDSGVISSDADLDVIGYEEFSWFDNKCEVFSLGVDVNRCKDFSWSGDGCKISSSNITNSGVDGSGVSTGVIECKDFF
ncbi:11999_t:CDS:2 [Diversispora eburnea]|uniref:11999_t:CDS:1 n=1 Tax=Diversispora eburnea TaxID=1213867 RepID=A0A9N8ZHX5_9GLOM|nr:11999_t:CDS:2 [Diversispora eburnea]